MSGFHVEIKRKDGCVLRSRPKDSSDKTPYKDSGVDEHFEVTVTYDGSNPDWTDPKLSNKKHVFCLTNALSKDSGSGFMGSVHYFSPNAIFQKITISEKYEDWKDAEIMGSGFPEPEYIVWVGIKAKSKTKEEITCPGMSWGIAGRPAKNK